MEQAPIAQTYPTQSPQERAVLIGVDWKRNNWTIDAELEELARLAETAELNVVGAVSQNLSHPNPTHYVGSGKLDEIRQLREELKYDVALVNEELSPSQLRNLEKALDARVIDRTALILDIFARHANTSEGRLQVELAQLEYRLPRLTRMWTHLSRQGVGGVGLRGPGETQLEVDRRQARQRISWIKSQLEDVHRHRQLYRERRQRERLPIVALVGYTNAGKSTLLNRLSGATVLAEDKLFATLDPTTRRLTVDGNQTILMTDTVGFINNLPTTLVDAFRATLEEVFEASVLVHVLDITHPNAAEQAETVRSVLEDLGADDKPIITALNKIDQLSSGAGPDELMENLGLSEDYIPVSAFSGEGIEHLERRIIEKLSEDRAFIELRVHVPFSETQLVDLFHRRGYVDQVDYDANGTIVEGKLPRTLMDRFQPFVENTTEVNPA